MKNLLVLVLVCASFGAWADSSSLNLNLPNSPQTYAQDRIRAGNFECQNAIGAATNFEFVGVYAKINIPIGGPKERINCNTLYELELQVKRMEVQKLKQEIQNLKNLSFVDEIEVVE